jgi:hypothetical protein
MSKVLVLGCGPAGLMAAHAASMMGEDVIIISKQRKSYLKGAQYLHRPIPLASQGSSFTVAYELRGEVAAYRDKVYGPGYLGTVSPEDLTETHLGWDIRSAYDWLWTTYGAYVRDERFSIGDHELVHKVLDWAKADIVISTIPAPLLCHNPMHTFRSEYVWSLGEESSESVFKPLMNHVICNGEDAPAWYRAANIQGHVTIEWPDRSKPPLKDLHHVEKPISTTCDCHPEVYKMGRYGKHEKGVLSDSAFFHTLDVITGPIQEGLF